MSDIIKWGNATKAARQQFTRKVMAKLGMTTAASPAPPSSQTFFRGVKLPANVSLATAQSIDSNMASGFYRAADVRNLIAGALNNKDFDLADFLRSLWRMHNPGGLPVASQPGMPIPVPPSLGYFRGAPVPHGVTLAEMHNFDDGVQSGRITRHDVMVAATRAVRMNRVDVAELVVAIWNHHWPAAGSRIDIATFLLPSGPSPFSPPSYSQSMAALINAGPNKLPALKQNQAAPPNPTVGAQAPQHPPLNYGGYMVPASGVAAALAAARAARQVPISGTAHVGSGWPSPPPKPVAMLWRNYQRGRQRRADPVDDVVLSMSDMVQGLAEHFGLTKPETMKVPMRALILWLAALAADHDGNASEREDAMGELAEFLRESLGREIQVKLVVVDELERNEDLGSL